MIIVDETLPIGELPLPFTVKNVDVKFNEDIRDSYELKKEIGRGRFGTVYLCNCKKTGTSFAAKFVNTKRNQDRENVEREIEIMKCLNPHPKLIQLYDAYDMGKEMCLILEVVQGGELFERVIDDDFILTERACAIFIRQIVEGVEFIHSKNILHLDMKPENILCISRQGNRVKICDFGLARKYDPRKKLQVLFGTPEFVAPEVVNFEPIGFGTDMWSIGVICYVLLSGLSPFMGHNYVETMTNVTHNKYDFDDDVFDEVSDEVKDFIEHLLLLDKNSRLTPEQCLRHPYLRQLSSAMEEKELSKSNLKKYMSKRRWNKAMHTVCALKRMGGFKVNNDDNNNNPKQACQNSISLSTNLKKTSSVPNIVVALSESKETNDSSTPSCSNDSTLQNSPNFQRCLSTVEYTRPQSNLLFSKTNVMSMSSSQLDTLFEEYDGYYDSKLSKKLVIIDEDNTNVINFKPSGSKTKIEHKSRHSKLPIIKNISEKKSLNERNITKSKKISSSATVNDTVKGATKDAQLQLRESKSQALTTDPKRFSPILETVKKPALPSTEISASNRTTSKSKISEKQTQNNTSKLSGATKQKIPSGENVISSRVTHSAAQLSKSRSCVNLVNHCSENRIVNINKKKVMTSQKLLSSNKKINENFKTLNNLQHCQSTVNLADNIEQGQQVSNEPFGVLMRCRSFVNLNPTIRNVRSAMALREKVSWGSPQINIRKSALVDQLLEEMKTDSGNALRKLEETHSLSKQEVMSKSVKPFIDTTSDGLPRSSGSVRTMAQRFTTKFNGL